MSFVSPGCAVVFPASPRPWDPPFLPNTKTSSGYLVSLALIFCVCLFFPKPLQECDSEHYSKHLTRYVGSVLISLNKRGEAADACRAGIAERQEVNLSLEEGSL